MNKLMPMPYKRNDYAKECEATLIRELEHYWQRGEVDTRWDVVCYCSGRFDSLNETHIEAIQYLYDDGFIKA